jgi:hypothetical protein
MITAQKLLQMAISYPDFRLNDIIDPDQFDTNNEEIVTHINGLVTQLSNTVDDLNAQDGKIATLTTDMGARLSLSTTTKTNLVSAINEVLSDLNAFKTLFETTYTASDVLTKLKTVDGTGSGLDADLLDGQHASYYATSTHNHDTAYAKKGTIANSMALVSDSSGNVVSSTTVTATELGYLDGVTSAIQTQLAGKSATSHNHDGVYSPNSHTHNYLPLGGGELTGSLVLNNIMGIQGKTVGGVAKSLVGVGSDDKAYIGDTTIPTVVKSSIAPKYTNGITNYDILTTDTAYTKGQIDTSLAGKASSTHNHDATYSLLGHTHTDSPDHNHDALYHQKMLGIATDFNTALTQGDYRIASATDVLNAPFTGAIYGKLRVYVNDGSTHDNVNNSIWQYFDKIGTTSSMYIRAKSASNAWTPWVKIWNGNNGGAGSGLDADKLDGQEGSYYSPTTHNHTSITGSSAKWTTPRTITLGGDLSGNVSIDGSANVTLSAQVLDDSHAHTDYLPKTGGTATGSISAPNLENSSGYFNIGAYNNTTYGDGKAQFYYDGVNNWVKVGARNADGTVRANPDILVNNAKVLTESSGFKSSGGTISGNVILNNNIALYGKDTIGGNQTLAYINSTNKAVMGSLNSPMWLRSSATPLYDTGATQYALYHAGSPSITVPMIDTNQVTTNGNNSLIVDAQNGGMAYMSFKYLGTNVGNVGKVVSDGLANMVMSVDNGSIGFYSGGKYIWYDIGTAFRPASASTNTIGLGGPGAVWKQLYAGTTTISTSDRDYKQDIMPITDEVLDAWSEVEYCTFKYKDAVAEKGDSARKHIGLIAQDIEEAFARHNLNAFDYGLLCYDEWENIYEYDNEKKANVLVTPKGGMYSIRADECQFLEIALQRRETNKLKEQLAQLLGGN